MKKKKNKKIEKIFVLFVEKKKKYSKKLTLIKDLIIIGWY